MRKTLALFAAALALVVFSLALGARNRDPRPDVIGTKPRLDVSPPDDQESFETDLRVLVDGPVRVGARLVGLGPQDLDLQLRLEALGPTASKAARAIALVIDRSGSMEGGRLEDVRRATKNLVAQLEDEDAVALISYGSDYRVDLPLTNVGGQRARIARVLDDLVEGGGSHLSAGLRAGHRALVAAPKRAHRQVILLTDGNANQGITDPALLEEMVVVGRKRGLHLSTLGVGLDFDEDLLARLASAGGGQYRFVEDSLDLGASLLEAAEDLDAVVAREVVVELELGPGFRLRDAVPHRSKMRDDGVYQVSLGTLRLGDVEELHLPLEARSHQSGPPIQFRMALTKALDGSECSWSSNIPAPAMATTEALRRELQAGVLEAEAALARLEAAAHYAEGRRYTGLQRLEQAIARLRRAGAGANGSRLQETLNTLLRSRQALQNLRRGSDEARRWTKREKLQAAGLR